MIKRNIIILFIFWYLIPEIHGLLNPSFYKLLYKGNITILSLFYSILFFLLTFQFSKIKFNIISIKQFNLSVDIFSNRFEWFFILIFFITSILFYYNYGLQFRQNGEDLSNTGFDIYINLISKSYIKVFLLKQFIISKYNYYHKPYAKLFFVFIGYFLSMSASLDFLFLFFIFIFIIKTDFLYMNFKKKMFILFLFSIPIILGVPFIGIANKIGYEQAIILIQTNYLYFFESIIRRIATWNQSINIYITFPNYKLGPLDIIINIFKTTFNRFTILFEGKKELPSIQSMFRFNYLNLYKYPFNNRTGSSPGIVATSLFFYFPIGLFFFSFLLGQLFKYINILIPNKINILFDIFISFLIVLPFITSPLDLLNFLTPITFYIIFFFSLRYNLLKNY